MRTRIDLDKCDYEEIKAECLHLKSIAEDMNYPRATQVQCLITMADYEIYLNKHFSHYDHKRIK